MEMDQMKSKMAFDGVTRVRIKCCVPDGMFVNVWAAFTLLGSDRGGTQFVLIGSGVAFSQAKHPSAT